MSRVLDGFTGNLSHIESLLFGILKGKEFIYFGHTDKGLARGGNRAQLRRRLKELIRPTSAFKNPPDVTTAVYWVEPKLTCRVGFWSGLKMVTCATQLLED
jgi:hypothetical protein